MQKSLSITKKSGGRAAQGYAYISLGRVYNNLCLLEKAEEFSQKGLNISKEIKLKKLEGHAYANFGHLYRHLGDLNTSFEFWEKALVFAKETGNKALEGFIKRSKTNSYMNLRMRLYVRCLLLSVTPLKQRSILNAA